MKMDDMVAKVDEVFDTLENTVDQMGNTVSTKQEIKAETDAKPEVKEAQTSTSTTWASERLKNGGAATETSVDLKGNFVTNFLAIAFNRQSRSNNFQ